MIVNIYQNMNIRSNIKKVLNESTYFRRRIDFDLMEKEFYETLNYVSDAFISRIRIGTSFNFREFKSRVISITMNNYHNDLSDGGQHDFPYDEIYELLSNHFEDKIKERYNLILNRNINESDYKEGKDQTKLIKSIIDSYGVYEYDNLCGFDIIPPEDGYFDKYYLIKAYFIGGLETKTRSIYNKENSMVEEISNYIESIVPLEIRVNKHYVKSCNGYEYLMRRKYSTDNLQESIKKILREQTLTGDTKSIMSVDTLTNKLINKPVNLVGDVNTSTIIKNVNINTNGSVNIMFKNGMNVNTSLPMLRTFNVGIAIPLEFKIKKKTIVTESEIKTNSTLHKLLIVLFDGFDEIDYDWANYMCGMGECCDPYAIGFTLPKSSYDDYLFKLVDGNKYDDDGDYPKEFIDELPEVCYEQPNLKNPDFDTIVFYGAFAEEIEDYMGPESNWSSDLLKIINNQFGCEAKRIIII